MCDSPNSTSGLAKDEARGYRDLFRGARHEALQDAEASVQVVQVAESYCRSRPENKGKQIHGMGACDCRKALRSLATSSPLANELPAEHSYLLTSFESLYALVTKARNDAVHQGAYARHMARHAVEFALVLEDALNRKLSLQISDYMVRNPLCAEPWHPLGYLRQQMLLHSYSFLPYCLDGDWYLISDQSLAAYLAEPSTDRNERLKERMDQCRLSLLPACSAEPTVLVHDALQMMQNGPLLVTEPDDKTSLVGIVTAFDLL